MKAKLLVLLLGIIISFGFLSTRLFAINRDNGESYKKQVLSQQRYDSKTLPARRGDILDSKGTKLAGTEKVYNLILDSYALNAAPEVEREEGNLNPLEETLSQLVSNFNLDASDLRSFLLENPSSRYRILKKQLTFQEIAAFRELLEDTAHPEITGVWFEEEYRRYYPNDTLACDLIGFTTGDGIGTYGLEGYYNATLNGVNGREYGFLNDDSALERTTIPAQDGYSLETTIDANIQQIVEKYLVEFDEKNKNAYREGNGAENVGCIVMDCNTGGILAMASYPYFHLNDPYNLSEWYTEEEIETLKDEDRFYDTCNQLWRNFCISDTYEPGSVAKMLTLATGIDTGKLKGNEHYYCNGSLEIGDHIIHCHNRYGDGDLSVTDAIAKSCNVALMLMAQAIGKTNFLNYEHIFNLGLRTNIDLYGESRTDSLVFNQSSMGPTELATASFGQGFNVTMIQMAAAFSSMVNGGKYYQPYVVKRIINSEGITVKNNEPKVIKQTVAESTSEKMREYGKAVVTDGTGKTARPAGYMIGGKTGTAEMVPRDKRNYVVSFMGFAPADNPQVLIYAVVDRPNTLYQDDAKFATGIVRNVLSEVLPYLNIPMTEELTDKEREELEEKHIEILEQYAKQAGGSTAEGAEGEEGEDAENPDTAEGSEEGAEDDSSSSQNPKPWTSFARDLDTGYFVDPQTGDLIDPETGSSVTGYTMMEPANSTIEEESETDTEDIE
ncbi:MAG: penicillin-binding protein 2 [Lachnospiraceae bacterium]|nr:penicillin-binding protein 2 [Lachnospiraceae bacterium]